MHSDPPTDAEIAALTAAIDAGLDALPQPEGELVALAGTATTVAALYLQLAEYDGRRVDGLRVPTAPGPLIMVVAFVGFLGGYQTAQMQVMFGPDGLFLAGALAACLVTWFTFLPSFIFILIGGPLVETTHGQLKFTAPLTAITAAVVGVILNLAMFFAYHVLWPQGFAGTFDFVSAGIALAAALALFRFKQSVMRVIAASALLGLLLKITGI